MKTLQKAQDEFRVAVFDEKLKEIAALTTEVERLRDALKAAQIELRSTAANWNEQCLFDCDAIMTAALKGETK